MGADSGLLAELGELWNWGGRIEMGDGGMEGIVGCRGVGGMLPGTDEYSNRSNACSGSIWV